jgi:hypothetical protein
MNTKMNDQIGTPVTDDEYYFQLNPFKDLPRNEKPVYDNDILLTKLDSAGLDVMINILKNTFKSKVSNMKDTRIPLEKRRNLLIKIILENIVRSTDVTLSKKILDTYFQKKVSIKRDVSWINDFVVGEIVLVRRSDGRNGFLKAKIVKINKTTLSVKMYHYTTITDKDALINQTYGTDRLIWGDCLGEIKNCYSSSRIIKLGQGNGALDDQFIEGKCRVDYGN